MKKTLLAVLMAAAFAPSMAMAEQGDWVVRLRAVSISPNEDSELGKTVNNLGLGDVMSPGSELQVDSQVIPELDISYYITKNIAVELILATGASHEVSVHGDSEKTVGNQELGGVRILPPTLTAQWHFMPDQKFDPYVGAGVSYVYSLDKNLHFNEGPLTGNKIRIDQDMWGPALQAGFDVNFEGGWLINADVKYIWLDTDVEMKYPDNSGSWTKIDDLDINPWVFGIGVGKKF